MPDPLTAISAGSAALGAAKGLFGDEPEGAQPSYGETRSGYESLPQFAKDIYEKQYGPGINEYFGSQQSRQAIPFNQYQNQAIQGYGQGIQDIQKNLGQYMNPYQQYVTDEINRGYDTQRNNLLGNASMGRNAAGFNNSALGVQFAQNDEARQRELARANYDNYQQALGLRRQSLADMLSAGNIQRGQAEYEQNRPFQRLEQLGSLLQRLPQGQSSSQTGAMEAQAPEANAFSKFGAFTDNLGNTYNNGAFNSIWNNGAPKAGTYGPPAPGIFNNMFGK